MSEVRCKKHDWHTEHVECAACVAEKMAVYDAAMELLAAADGAVSFQDFQALEDKLLAACRRAKEG